jgi:hypothetical protein
LIPHNSKLSTRAAGSCQGCVVEMSAKCHRSARDFPPFQVILSHTTPAVRLGSERNEDFIAPTARLMRGHTAVDCQLRTLRSSPADRSQLGRTADSPGVVRTNSPLDGFSHP